MQCPECHAFAVIKKNGGLYCQAARCPYVDFHAITYENEIRQFEDGEKNSVSRVSFSNGRILDNQNQVQVRINQSYATNRRLLQELGAQMELAPTIIRLASQRLHTIITVKYEKEIKVSGSEMYAYALYCACFEKGMKFKEVRIANELGIKKREWEALTRNIGLSMGEFIPIPKLKLSEEVRRVPQKRKINKVQIDAMVEMAKRIETFGLQGGHRQTTISACIFWQILKRSETYNPSGGKFSMEEYIRQDKEEDQKYWTQKHFWLSFDSVRNYYSKYIKKEENNIVPHFSTCLS